MAIDYAALRAEGTNDPLNLGYAQLIADGNDQALADLLNAPRPGTISASRTLVDAWEFVNAIATADYLTLTQAQRDYLVLIASAGSVQLGGGGVRDALTALFGAATVTRARLIALLTRPASRAEQLFGDGVTVTAADIALARRA